MKTVVNCLVVALLAGSRAPGCVQADDRMPPVPLEKYTDAQKHAVRELAIDRQRPVHGPLVPLLRSPELMLATKAVGDYLRLKSVLPPRIAELAVLVVCREWTQQVAWQMHYPMAVQAGLPYVSRGGYKLAGGLDHWSLDVSGFTCIDVGGDFVAVRAGDQRAHVGVLGAIADLQRGGAFGDFGDQIVGDGADGDAGRDGHAAFAC